MCFGNGPYAGSCWQQNAHEIRNWDTQITGTGEPPLYAVNKIYNQCTADMLIAIKKWQMRKHDSGQAVKIGWSLVTNHTLTGDWSVSAAGHIWREQIVFFFGGFCWRPVPAGITAAALTKERKSSVKQGAQGWNSNTSEIVHPQVKKVAVQATSNVTMPIFVTKSKATTIAHHLTKRRAWHLLLAAGHRLRCWQ